MDLQQEAITQGALLHYARQWLNDLGIEDGCVIVEFRGPHDRAIRWLPMVNEVRVSTPNPPPDVPQPRGPDPPPSWHAEALAHVFRGEELPLLLAIRDGAQTARIIWERLGRGSPDRKGSSSTFREQLGQLVAEGLVQNGPRGYVLPRWVEAALAGGLGRPP
jgi:hypothetical protein